MKCTQCDTAINSKSVYCNTCGLKVGKSEIDELVNSRKGFSITSLLKTLRSSSNEEDENSARYWFERGINKIDEEQFFEAIEYFKRANSIDPQMGLAVANLGWCCLQVGKPFHGIEWTRKAIDMGIDSKEILGNLCNAYQDTAQYAMALRTIDELMEIDPGNSHNDEVKRHLAKEKSGYREIIDEFEQFGSVWNGNVLFMVQPDENGNFDSFSSGMLSCNEEDFDEAISFFEEEIQSGGIIPGSTTFIGYCLNRLGRLDDAIIWLSKAIQNNPEDWFACSFLADTYMRKNEFFNALSAIEHFSVEDLMVKHVKVQILKAEYEYERT